MTSFDLRHLRRGIAALVVLAAGLVVHPALAQEPSAEDQLDDVRERSAQVDLELDVLTAEDSEVSAALASIQTNVAGQRVTVTAATDALDSAEADVAESAAAIEGLETEIAALEELSDRMLVEAYVDPPINHALDMLDADTLSDATVKSAIVEIQADADATAIERLDGARADLEDEKAEQEVLVEDAAAKKTEADTALADLESALGQQEAVLADVEARLAEKQAEADRLAASDAALSAEIAAEEARLAAAAAAAESAASAPTPASPGGITSVSCAGGGTISVAGSIAGAVQSLLDDSSAAGVSLCGGGFRDPQEQIELRRAHCGTSDYAIYEMPSSQCSPPTARPGSSMHELGLAIDFTCNGGGTVSRGSSCWSWLSANAGSYGLYNLPSESWHWSTNGN